MKLPLFSVSFFAEPNPYPPNATENIIKPRDPQFIPAPSGDGIQMASAKPTLTRLETRAVEEDSRSDVLMGIEWFFLLRYVLEPPSSPLGM